MTDQTMTDEDIRARNVANANAFLDLLTAKDMDAWAELWAENAVQDMPFSPAGFPARVEGRAALIEHYSSLPDATGRMVFVDRNVRPMLDPNVVLLEYRGEIEILPTGKDYDNTYAGLFEFDADGRIVLFREYFDPNVLSEAWAGAPADGFGSGERSREANE